MKLARPRRFCTLLLLLGLCPAVSVSAQEDSPPRVPRASGPIQVDAHLDEPVWESALVLPLLYETRPGENVDPPVETRVYLTHDDQRLYVAFDALDPEPGKIRARLTDRDNAWQDDFVGVVLDTFNDERRAFEFFVNPYGAQMDLFQDDVNQNEDASWDAIWSSAGRITELGYVVEMAIPFNALSFPRSNGLQTWGLDAIRFYPRSDRVRISTNPMDRNRNCYLCQLSKVEGFEGITPGRNVQLIPTLTAGRTDAREDFPGGDLEDGSVESELGITGTWGVTPNMTLSGTINPDFSQVEADAGQLGINEQFALFFPERRPFFLEGADFFDTPLDAVFTRNVADPRWGLKLTGKEGKNGLGVFVAEDEITNLIIPGSQGSRATSLDLESTDATLRYRRDLGSNSALGGLFTSREGGDYSNRVGGVDGLYRFTDSSSLVGQILTSETRYPASVAAAFDQPTDTLSDQAYSLRYRLGGRNWRGQAGYDDVGEDFRADMGFMPRVGYTFAIAGLERVWHGEPGDWYNRISFGGDVDRTEDQHGGLLEEEYELFLNYSGPREGGFFVGPGMRNRVFEGVEFDQSYLNWSGWVQATADLFLNTWGTIGDGIDFTHVRPGDQIDLGFFGRYTFGEHLRTTLSHDYRTLDVDGGTLFEANLSRLRTVYQINLRTFVPVILEYTDISRNPDLYASEVDRKTEDLFTQLLFSYKINPQTVAFLGYSDNYLAHDDISLTQENRALFFKVGYAWVL